MTDRSGALSPEVQQAIRDGAVLLPPKWDDRQYNLNGRVYPPELLATAAQKLKESGGYVHAEDYHVKNGMLHVEGLEPMKVTGVPTVFDQINVRKLMQHVGEQIKAGMLNYLGDVSTEAELQAYHARVSAGVERYRPMMEAAGICVTSLETYREPNGDSGVKIASAITPIAPVEFISVSFKMRPMFCHLPRRLRKRAMADLVAGLKPKPVF